MARAIAKGQAVADYRSADPPTTAMIIDWLRGLVTGATAEDCHDLAADLAAAFGGMVQLKYPAAPGTATAKAAFGVTPLMLTVLVGASSLCTVDEISGNSRKQTPAMTGNGRKMSAILFPENRQ